MRFNKNYFSIALCIFIIEILIALFINDRFIRPYFGDVRVVILIYCFVKAFLKIPVIPLTICVLIFSFVIEYLQYVKIVEKLGLGNSAVATTIIGTSFAWIDLLAYSIGILTVLITEKYFSTAKQKTT